MKNFRQQNRIYFPVRYAFVICLSFFVMLIASYTPLLAKNSITFIQITDTHISENPKTHQILKNVLEDINQLAAKPAFVINTGDITEFGSEIEFKYYQSPIDGSGLRLFNIPGNHDVRWSNIGKKRFIARLGDPFQSFEAGGIHFIMLDSSLMLEQYGHFSHPQLSWLKHDLQVVGNQKPIIIAAHHPLFLEKNYVDNEFELLELLEGYNIILFLCGHGHRNVHWQANGIHFLMTQAVKSNPPGYRIFEIDSDSIRVFNRNLRDHTTAFDFSSALFRACDEPRFRVHEPKPAKSYDRDLSVLITSDRLSQIEASLDGKKWELLNRNDNRFTINFDLAQFCEGNHYLKLKSTTINGKLWISHVPIQIDRGKINSASSFRTNDTIVASPAIVNNTIFIGSLDSQLYAIDIENMNLKWAFKTGGPVVTTPAFHQDTLFATSGDGWCYALNKNSGIQIWKTKIAEAIFSSPAYSDGRLFFGASDSALHALKSSDGSSLWKYRTNDYIKAHPAMSKDKIFFGSWDRYFYCISKDDASLFWKQKISDNRYFPAATSNPVVHNDRIFVASHDHIVHAFQVSNGELIWNHPTNASNKPGYSSPIVAGNRLWFGSLSGHLFALDTRSGENVWTTALPDSINPDLIFDSSPAMTDTQVVVGSISGVLYGTNRETGRLDWSYKLSDGYIFSSPAIRNNYVIVGSCDGNVYKIQIPFY